MNSPEIVREVHQEFIAAGSEVITTNSYALVPFHIGEDRFQQEGPALIRLAGRLARERRCRPRQEGAGRRLAAADLRLLRA